MEAIPARRHPRMEDWVERVLTSAELAFACAATRDPDRANGTMIDASANMRIILNIRGIRFHRANFSNFSY